jgi:peptidoglycan/LPS O-acetylase OafA/YrhL
VAPLQQLGRYSYGLYVIHFFVHEAAAPLLQRWPAGAAALATRGGVLAWAAAATGATLGLAWLSWHLVEQPFLALKSRFAPRPRPAASG